MGKEKESPYDNAYVRKKGGPVNLDDVLAWAKEKAEKAKLNGGGGNGGGDGGGTGGSLTRKRTRFDDIDR